MPAGFCMMIWLSSANTLIQSLVPDHLRGRVMSVYSMMFLGMVPFGSHWPALADHLGAPATVAIGTACITAAWHSAASPALPWAVRSSSLQVAAERADRANKHRRASGIAQWHDTDLTRSCRARGDSCDDDQAGHARAVSKRASRRLCGRGEDFSAGAPPMAFERDGR
jgi:hypothetical protein